MPESQQRPPLDNRISVEDFRAYYWLKEELIAFCREHGLSTAGSKIDIADRIAYYLEHGTAPATAKRQTTSKTSTASNEPLALDQPIRENYRSDEEHRQFFESVIGPQFKFTVGFMRFCKENIGKQTYADAVEWWLAEHERKRDPSYKPEIEPQFEYNRFVRAYFEHNPDGTREEAIRLWKETKSKPGDNVYRPSKE
jgi:hypothetical protein